MRPGFLAAFGQCQKAGDIRFAPVRTDVDGLPERGHHRLHVGPRPLPAFDLERADPRAHQIRQQARQVQADRLLERVIGLLVRGVVTALADRRISGVFAAGDTVDGEVAEPGFEVPLAVFLVMNMARRRADPVHVGRQTGDVVGEQAAAFGHHADIAEYERLDLAADLVMDPADFRNRQNARQPPPADAEGAAVKVDRLR